MFRSATREIHFIFVCLQLQFATQVRAVQAFKRSLKRSSKGKEKKEDGEAEPGCNKELVGLCKSPLTSSQPQDQPGCERRNRRSGEDDVDYEVRTEDRET